MAIALDGGVPDSDPDGQAGHHSRARFDAALLRLSAPPSAFTNPNGRVSTAYDDSAFSAQTARTESFASGTAGAGSSAAAAAFDARLVKESFAHLIAVGPVVMEYFYARLFASSPETQSLFPITMAALHEHVFAALAEVIECLDAEHERAERLARLGRDHRKFGVRDRHYREFFAALLETVRHFMGASWRPEVETAWQDALAYMSATMRAAAAEQAAVAPPWWIGEIVEHQIRSPGVAVLKVAPNQPLAYLPGQYVAVQVTRWPRVWRPYSIACAPRPSGLLELHVRAVPGGLVSNTLVYHCGEGDTVLLGCANGTMTLTESSRDLLCVAGGTGLAPIKALIEQAIASAPTEGQRKITLFYGARQYFDLYDLQDLQLLEAAYPGLHVLPVLSDEPGYGGLTGTLPDVLRANGTGMFGNTEAYICGPAPMVMQTAALLAASLPPGRIHHDPVR